MYNKLINFTMKDLEKYYNKKLLNNIVIIYNRKYIFRDIVFIRNKPQGIVEFIRYDKLYKVHYDLEYIYQNVNNGIWNTFSYNRNLKIKRLIDGTNK